MGTLTFNKIETVGILKGGRKIGQTISSAARQLSYEEFLRIEKKLRTAFPIGSQIIGVSDDGMTRIINNGSQRRRSAPSKPN